MNQLTIELKNLNPSLMTAFGKAYNGVAEKHLKESLELPTTIEIDASQLQGVRLVAILDMMSAAASLSLTQKVAEKIKL